ncbi:hypothetical protein ACHZ97_09450 [Lysobacter soli]|uniref:hypothetical protein n=1 Tax=Lysobacter soli TaxID=453783 RepID=UPI0037C77036
MTSHPDLPRENIGRSGTWRIVGAVITVLGSVLLALAAAFAAAAIYAVATIPTGTANDAGFGFQLAFCFAVAGFVVLGVGH